MLKEKLLILIHLPVPSLMKSHLTWRLSVATSTLQILPLKWPCLIRKQKRLVILNISWRDRCYSTLHQRSKDEEDNVATNFTIENYLNCHIFKTMQNFKSVVILSKPCRILKFCKRQWHPCDENFNWIRHIQPSPGPCLAPVFYYGKVIRKIKFEIFQARYI